MRRLTLCLPLPKETKGRTSRLRSVTPLLSALDRVAADDQLAAFSKSEEVEQAFCMRFAPTSPNQAPNLPSSLGTKTKPCALKALLAIARYRCPGRPRRQTFAAVDPKGLPLLSSGEIGRSLLQNRKH